jgi:hypothetical protein
MKVNLRFTFVLALIVGACTPIAPLPVVPFDASDARAPIPAPTTAPDSPSAGPPPTADCEAACANIAQVGCLTELDCARVLCSVNADPRFRHYDLACLIHAMMPSDVAVCGLDCLLKDPSSLARPQ